ncbi:family 10 glycosylhydrolase [Fodinicola feengrottensis]|uniref:Family 10 glycosylhydrolase n=1 Tax=Fodinicola feengrottensis TaxID=435914 RepID=A0ABN2HU21_9ACTN
MSGENPVDSSAGRRGRLTRRQFGALSAGLGGVALSAGLAGPAAAAEPTVGACQPSVGAPKYQLRGLWIASVVNIDWPSTPGLSADQQKAELLAWYDLAVHRGLNAVMLQIRPTADAFWPSPLEPWSQYLTGQQGGDPGYDPLAFAVSEAHKRNLELHGWFNPYRVSMQTDPNQLLPTHPARQHPDWVFPYGPKLYYNPGIPAVRAFVQDAIMDAVTRYDLDGVHFDDYFYPYPIAGQTVPDAQTFATYGKGFASIDDWRRDNINRLVQEMGDRIHRVKPWVKFGISPFGIWRNASTDPRGSDTNGLQSYDAIGADTRLWVKNEWLDYINPQIYWNQGLAVADYSKLVPWWASVAAGTTCQLYIGEATYKVGTSGAWLDPAELSRHLTFDQGYPQVQGNVYFSAVDVRADKLGATSMLTADHYSHPALTPPMPHLRRGRPAPVPPIVSAHRANGGATLVLRAPGWDAGLRPRSYAIYRFDGIAGHSRCDFADATHLVAVVPVAGRTQSYVDTSAAVGRTYTYFASAVDRLSAESQPIPAILL